MAAAPGPPPGSQQRTSGKAIAALILGLAGFFYCPIVCSILGIVFGAMARSDVRSDPTLKGGGMATAGLVLGAAWLVVMPIVIVLWGMELVDQIEALDR